MDLILHADTTSVPNTALSGILWSVTTVYAIAYLETRRSREAAFSVSSLCVSATIGIALSGNLITFFISTSLLTLSTYPLVAPPGHTGRCAPEKYTWPIPSPGGAFLLIPVSPGCGRSPVR